jgi:tetratricopeptide (TPR) repeat protein
LRRAISVRDDEAAFIELLSAQVEAADYDAGLVAAEEAVRRHPSSAELHGRRALLLSLKGQYDAAEAAYHRALDLAPGTEWFRSGLSMILLLTDRPEEARNTLQPYLERLETDHALYLYAESLNRLGLDRSGPSRERARLALEKALEVNPGLAPARLQLARIYVAQQEWPKAITQLRAATELDPGDKRPYYELAQVYQRIGERAASAEMLQIVRRLNETERSQPPEEFARGRIAALQRTLVNPTRK